MPPLEVFTREWWEAAQSIMPPGQHQTPVSIQVLGPNHSFTLHHLHKQWAFPHIMKQQSPPGRGDSLGWGEDSLVQAWGGAMGPILFSEHCQSSPNLSRAQILIQPPLEQHWKLARNQTVTINHRNKTCMAFSYYQHLSAMDNRA